MTAAAHAHDVRVAIAAIVVACAHAGACADSTVRVQADAARGGADYGTYCAPCHGVKGAGDGPLARTLTPRPVRHDDAVYMDRLSDAYLMLLLKEGGPALGKSALMGKWGRRLSHEQLEDIVAYMRSLKR